MLKNDGFSLVEVVIAVGLIAMLAVALAGLSTLSIARSQNSRAQAAATKLAQEEMELLRAFRDKYGLSALTCTSP